MAGWIMLLASIVTVAAVAVAWQIILPQISPHFQFIGDGSGNSFAENAVLLGFVLICITTTINILGVGIMAKINNVGVAAELIGANFALIILLLFNATRGPQVGDRDARQGAKELPGYASLRLPRGVPDRRHHAGLRHVRLRHRGLAGRGDE